MKQRGWTRTGFAGGRKGVLLTLGCLACLLVADSHARCVRAAKKERK